MLKWYICKNNPNVWEGYCDGDLLYRVFLGHGWEWEDVPAWEGGYDYDTEEEAMTAAEAHFAERLEREEKILLIDLEVSLEEIEEILGDMLFEERREEKLFN